MDDVDPQLPKDSSKGFDAWNFNNNLKEFSETRQLFRTTNHNSNSNAKANNKLEHSPYLGHKTKTHDLDLRTLGKVNSRIKANNSNKLEGYSNTTIRDNSTFREHNRTLSTIKYDIIDIFRKETLQPLDRDRKDRRDNSEPHALYSNTNKINNNGANKGYMNQGTKFRSKKY